jgi:hypothetical protein
MKKLIKSIAVIGLCLLSSSAFSSEKVKTVNTPILACASFDSILEVYYAASSGLNYIDIAIVAKRQGDCVQLYRGQKYVVTQRAVIDKRMAEILFVSGHAEGYKMYIIDRGY